MACEPHTSRALECMSRSHSKHPTQQVKRLPADSQFLTIKMVPLGDGRGMRQEDAVIILVLNLVPGDHLPKFRPLCLYI